MISTMSTHVVKVISVIVVVYSVLNSGCYGADPDPLTDFAPGLTTFTLRNIFFNGDVTVDSGGVRAATSVANIPAIQSQGIGMVRFKMVPCGANLPHTHPRATEMLALLSGGPLQVGFVDTQGKAFIDILHPGDVTIFPRGTMHFELNVGHEEANYLSALNSQNPGTLTSSEAILHLPVEVVATAFNITPEMVRILNSTIYEYGSGLKKTWKSGCFPRQDVNVNISDQQLQATQ